MQRMSALLFFLTKLLYFFVLCPTFWNTLFTILIRLRHSVTHFPSSGKIPRRYVKFCDHVILIRPVRSSLLPLFISMATMHFVFVFLQIMISFFFSLSLTTFFLGCPDVFSSVSTTILVSTLHYIQVSLLSPTINVLSVSRFQTKAWLLKINKSGVKRHTCITFLVFV